MPKIIEKFELDKVSFNRLMNWLHTDYDTATELYFDIHQKLVFYFLIRECAEAEELADETFDRVMVKLSEEEIVHDGSPLRYFYSIAKFIHQEYERNKNLQLEEAILFDREAEIFDENEEKEILQNQDYLKKCVSTLKTPDRKLLMEYYGVESGRELEKREDIAKKNNLTTNSLRVKIFRLRNKLKKCVEKKQL